NFHDTCGSFLAKQEAAEDYAFVADAPWLVGPGASDGVRETFCFWDARVHAALSHGREMAAQKVPVLQGIDVIPWRRQGKTEIGPFEGGQSFGKNAGRAPGHAFKDGRYAATTANQVIPPIGGRTEHDVGLVEHAKRLIHVLQWKRRAVGADKNNIC